MAGPVDSTRCSTGSRQRRTTPMEELVARMHAIHEHIARMLTARAKS